MIVWTSASVPLGSGSWSGVNEPAGVVVDRLAAAGVHVAHRRGRIRISPHLYNTQGEIDRALDLL